MVVNVFLFDDFEVMDAFGPVESFWRVPEHFYVRFISLRGGLITGKQEIKIWTEPLNPVEIEDIFLIPGGTGVKSFLHMEGENGQQLLKQAVEEASFCMMVQNASALLARTGLLFHRQVADYAYDENWKRMFTVGIDYIDGEKWISDGKYYSCSTTVAAMDMTFALISDNLDVSVAEKIAEDGFENSSDIDAYLDDAEKSVLDISRNRKTAEFRTPQDVMRAVMERVQMMSENKSDITGYKTGFVALDHRLHGFQKGDLVILAARPAMGKTAVALNLAMNVATYNQPGAVAIFSLEMPAEQLGMRLLSARSHVPGDNIKTGRLSNDEWNAVNEAAADLGKLPVYIDDTSMIKIPEIFSKCRRLQAEHGLNLVLIDYIQLITGSGKRGDNRQQEVSDISRSLKALARELGVPVIALSQLSRTVEQREDKHPMLSDLRESGAIEQDADIVLMLYREAYYKDEAKEAAQESGSEKLEINIAKHRNGSTGRVIVAFEGATNALYNIQNDNDFIPNE